MMVRMKVRPHPLHTMIAPTKGLDMGQTHLRGVRQWMNVLLAFTAMASVVLAWLHVANAQAPAVRIRHPQPEQTIHDNNGVVRVSLALEGLTLSPDYRLRVLVDGEPYASDQRVPEFTLQDVERGEHSLQVQVINTKNAVVAASSTVKFHVWRASALFPARKPATTHSK